MRSFSPRDIAIDIALGMNDSQRRRKRSLRRNESRNEASSAHSRIIVSIAIRIRSINAPRDPLVLSFRRVKCSICVWSACTTHIRATVFRPSIKLAEASSLTWSQGLLFKQVSQEGSSSHKTSLFVVGEIKRFSVYTNTLQRS